MDPVYNAAETLKEVHRWKKPGVPMMRISVLKSLVAVDLKEDMVVVNVNWGPHMTYIGLVSALHDLVLYVYYFILHNILTTSCDICAMH